MLVLEDFPLKQLVSKKCKNLENHLLVYKDAKK